MDEDTQKQIDELKNRIEELEGKINTKDLAFALLVGQFVEARIHCPPCFQKTLEALIDDLFGNEVVRQGFTEIVNSIGKGR